MRPGERCETCGASRKIVNKDNIKGELQCCAHPPQMFAIPVQTGGGAVFMPANTQPAVQGDGWCAEWRPVDVPAAANG